MKYHLKKLVQTIAVIFIAAQTVSCTQDAMIDSLTKNEEARVLTNQISIEEALENAERAFSVISRDTRSARSVKSIKKIQDTSGTRSNNEADTKYYIVNYEDDMGFAVLSADRRIGEVYAISDEGSLSLEDSVNNSGLSLFFSGLDALYGLRENITPPMLPKDSIAEKFYVKVGPMVPKNVALWHGDTYDDRKLDYPLSTVLTAQIMATFAYPRTGSYSNYTTGERVSVEYDWEKIRDCILPVDHTTIYACDYYRDLLDLYKTITVGEPDTTILWNNHDDSIDYYFGNFYYEVKVLYSIIGHTWGPPEQAYLGNTKAFKEVLDAGKIILADDEYLPSMASIFWLIDGYIKNPILVDGNILSQFGVDTMFHCVWGDGGKRNGYFMFLDKGDPSKNILSVGTELYENPILLDNPDPSFLAWKNHIENVCFAVVYPRN